MIGYHEGLEAAQEIRKRNLHMLFNLPGVANVLLMCC